jgi:hypothetical protein
MSNFRPIDRDTGFLLPPSVDEWLPEKHLARFVVEVIDGLDLTDMCRSYRGTGSACYHPALLLAFWCMAMQRRCFRAAGWSGVITHPGMDIGWVSSAVRMARMTAVWLAFAVLTTERNAA